MISDPSYERQLPSCFSFPAVREEKIRTATGAEADPRDLGRVEPFIPDLVDVDPGEVEHPFSLPSGRSERLPPGLKDLRVYFIATEADGGPYGCKEVAGPAVKDVHHLSDDLGGDAERRPLSSCMDSGDDLLSPIRDEDRKAICRADPQKHPGDIRDHGIVFETPLGCFQWLPQNEDSVLVHLVEKNQTPWIKAEGCGNSGFVLGYLFVPVAIVMTHVERFVGRKAYSSIPGEETVGDPSEIGELRSLEIGKIVLCFEIGSVERVHPSIKSVL